MNTNDIVLTQSYGQRLTRVFIYSSLIFMALVYLFPLLVVLLTSLKSMADIRSGNLLSLPSTFSLQSWHDALFTACIGVSCSGLYQQFVNSFILVIPAVILSTSLGALNGFALTQFKFRGHNLVFGFLLLGVFLPLQIVLVPLAHVLGFLNISNSIAGLILVHVVYGIPFTTLFFRNFFITVPSEITSAARIDGAGFMQIMLRVVLPISIPSFVVSFIWQFTNIWNDYLFAATYTSGDSSPVTVGLYGLVASTMGVKQYNVDMAATVLSALPTLLVYIFAGRFFIRGLVAGAVKG